MPFTFVFKAKVKRSTCSLIVLPPSDVILVDSFHLSGADHPGGIVRYVLQRGLDVLVAHELLDVLYWYPGVLQEGRMGSPEGVHGEFDAQFLREPYHAIPQALVTVRRSDTVSPMVVE